MRLEIYIEPILEDSNDEKWNDDEVILDTLQEVLPRYDVDVDVEDGDELVVTIRGSENDIRALAGELRQRVPVVQVMGDEDCVCYGHAIPVDLFTSIGQIEYFCVCDCDSNP